MSELDLICIGRSVRRFRQARGLTVDALAQAAGLSKGQVSKVENFRTVPSLQVLARIAAALRTDMAELVRGVGASPAPSYTLLRKAEREEVEREDAVGFRYQALFTRELDACFFQSLALSLAPDARRAPATSDGEEILVVLAGAVDLVLGDESVALAEGDAIRFDGRVPHVTRNPGPVPAEMLVLYFLRNRTD